MKITFEGSPEECLAEMKRICLANDSLLHTTDHPEGQKATAGGAVSNEQFDKDFGSGLVKVLEDKMDGEEPFNDPLPESMKPAKVSRRKPVAGKAKPVTKPEPVKVVLGNGKGGIGDSDIQKAASETAMQTSPDVVKAIMKDIGAGKKKLHELSNDERENFLAASKAAIEKHDD